MTPPTLEEALEEARSVIDGQPSYATVHLQVLVNEISRLTAELKELKGKYDGDSA